MKRLIIGCLMAPLCLLGYTPSNPDAWIRKGHQETVRHDMASPVGYAYGGDYVAVLHREGRQMTLKTKQLAATEWTTLHTYESDQNSELSIHHGTFLLRKSENEASIYNLHQGQEIASKNSEEYHFFSEKYWGTGSDGHFEVFDAQSNPVCMQYLNGKFSGGVARGDTLYAVVEPSNLADSAEVRNYHLPSGKLKGYKVLREYNWVSQGILMPGERVGRTAKLIASDPREDRLCFEMPVLKNGAKEHKRSVLLMLNEKLEPQHVLWCYSGGNPYSLQVCEPLLLIRSGRSVKQRYLKGRVSATIQMDEWVCDEGFACSTPVIAYPALQSGRGIRILVATDRGTKFWTLPVDKLLEGLDLESGEVKLHIGGDTLLIVVDDPNHAAFTVASVHVREK